MAVRSEYQGFGTRLAAAILFALLMLSALVFRLWYLQGVYGSYFRDLSENNRVRTIRTAPARGTIFDRDGRILVANRPAFNIALLLEDIPDLDQTLGKLSDVTGRPIDELRRQLGAQKGRHPFEPKIVIADVSRQELARVKANSYQLPGVIIDVFPTRNYPHGALAAQIFGYSREISKKQLEQLADDGYRIGDVVGQEGLEKYWEKRLRGQSGYRQVEVDAMGNRKGELGIVDDLPGQDLYLNIDLDLQNIASAAFADKKGAAVVLDPRSGEVLALVSAPSYDPNMFATEMRGEDWTRVASDREKPLNNRTISDVYPIGSTFKLVTSVAGLAEKKISPDMEINCPGFYMFAGRPYHCHKRSGHGIVNLKRALTVSCNTYYFTLGQMLGIELIEKYARMLGLGTPTGIDLPGELSGIVPSERWKKERYGEKWYPGDTLPVSIGQGYLVVTPIQMALAISTIANSGTVYRPFLVRKVVNHVTGEETAFEPAVVKKATIKPEVFKIVRELALGVVNDKSGTGRAARIEGINVGGKTGTAQVISLGKKSQGDHAWFIAFAPEENPMIAMAILVEHGGHGGTAAAPISKLIMETYFKKKNMLPEPTPAPTPAPKAGAKPKPAEPPPEEQPEEVSD